MEDLETKIQEHFYLKETICLDCHIELLQILILHMREEVLSVDLTLLFSNNRV
jgi:hypothetical protein